MKIRLVIAIVAVTTVVALLLARPFAASMTLVFGVLALVAGAVARDAFVPDRPDGP